MPRPKAAFIADPDPKPTAGTCRPRLLVAAARHGIADYRSARDLPRLVGPGVPGEAVTARLAELEARMEAARQAGDPGWSCLRHVEVMIALLAERALRLE